MDTLIKKYHIPSRVYTYERIDSTFRICEQWDNYFIVVDEHQFKENFEETWSKLLCIRKPINVELIELERTTNLEEAVKFFKNTNLSFSVHKGLIDLVFDKNKPNDGVCIDKKICFIKYKNKNGVDYDIDNKDIYWKIIVKTAELSRLVEGFYKKEDAIFKDN